MFTAVAEEGKDDLLDELNELEAEAIEDELGMEMDLGPMANIPAAAQPAAAQPAAVASDEQEMAQLAAMM